MPLPLQKENKMCKMISHKEMIFLSNLLTKVLNNMRECNWTMDVGTNSFIIRVHSFFLTYSAQWPAESYFCYYGMTTVFHQWLAPYNIQASCWSSTTQMSFLIIMWFRVIVLPSVWCRWSIGISLHQVHCDSLQLMLALSSVLLPMFRMMFVGPTLWKAFQVISSSLNNVSQFLWNIVINYTSNYYLKLHTKSSPGSLFGLHCCLAWCQISPSLPHEKVPHLSVSPELLQSISCCSRPQRQCC
jgi:hypothetical protein